LLFLLEVDVGFFFLGKFLELAKPPVANASDSKFYWLLFIVDKGCIYGFYIYKLACYKVD
jgi:hypothetical protein